MGPRLYVASALMSVVIASSPCAAETIRVNIDMLAFTPAQVSAHVGDTIEWTNKDFIAHTATARKNEWDVTIPVNGTGRVTLLRAGDIEYYCRFHPNMVGHISVSEK